MAPDLSVIIVAYNCADELAACLESLAAGHDDLEHETIVVDNASPDGTADRIREAFPDVALLANRTNRGFAAANNQGLALSSGRNVLFLNPDTVVRGGALAVLVRTLDGDDTVGACGPQLRNPDGSIQPSVRSDPTFASLLHQYTPLRMLRVFRPAYRRYKRADLDFETACDVDTVMGAALSVRRRVLAEVGPMDERFFVYHEEADLCLRIRQAGYRVRFEPAATITHTGGVSAATTIASAYLLRSLFRFLYKHHGRLRGWAMVQTLRFGILVREVLQLLGSAGAATGLALVGQTERAARRRARAATAARFLARDWWLAWVGA